MESEGSVSTTTTEVEIIEPMAEPCMTTVQFLLDASIALF